MCDNSQSNFKTFVERLKKQSTIKEYEKARNEWVPVKYWEVVSSVQVKCLCGAPIKRVLLVKNIFNGNEVIVGVNCARELILKAIGENALKDFKTIVKNHSVIPNPALAIYARLENLINEKEYNFLVDMSREIWSELTPTQKHWLFQINRKLVFVIRYDELSKIFWPYYTIYR